MSTNLDPLPGQPEPPPPLRVSEESPSQRRLRGVDERRAAALELFDTGSFQWTIPNPALAVDDTLGRILDDDPDRLRAMDDLIARVHEADRWRLARACERCAAEAAALHEEVRIRRADGTVRWLEIRGRVHLGADRRPHRVVGACADVTDRRRREEAKAALLAVTSHELRTPLNAIAGYAALLAEGIAGPLSSRQAEIVGKAQRACRHLMRLVDSVLTHAKAESGAMDYAVEDVAVGDVLDDVEPLTAPQRAAKSLVYDCSGCDRGMVLAADRDKLVRVMVNLVANAIKFTPTAGRIVVTTRRAPPGYGSLCVRDTGIGMTPDQVATAFEPFVQFASGGERQGVGLGLPISRELARGMGGELELVSERGRGSTFTLVLPLARRE